MTVFHGTKHDDTFNESSDTSSDTFNLYKGGNDTVIAGSGDDLFKMGISLNAGDRLDGGDGRDIVILHGDYSAGVVFDDQTIQNIEVLRLRGGFDYNLTVADGNVAAGEKLTINAAKLGVGNHLTFDGSAETDGRFLIYGGAGDDTITGGAKSDVFHLENGGNDTVHGGGGNDVFNLGGALTASDSIDGGSGDDTLELGNAGSPITFIANTIQSIETLKIDGSVNLFLDDGNVTAGATLTVDASAAGSTVAVNGSAETDGAFDFIAGTGGDLFSGGAGNDFFDMSNTGGTSTEKGNGGDDTFLFAANFDRLRDNIDGGGGSDTLEFNGTYTSLALSDAHLTSIETLKFLGGHSYAGITITGDIADGSTLTIDASVASNISIDLTAATSAAYAITGSAGDDTIKFANNFSVSDTVDGGTGNDTLELGANSGSITATFTANTMTNVETLKIDGSVNLFLDDGNVTAGATLTVDASAAGSTVAVNGSAETNGTFDFIAGTGGDLFSGGAGNDFFDMSNTGGTSTEKGNGGDDTFLFAANFDRLRDSIDGGADSDTLEFNGAYTSLALSDAHLTSIETLTFLGNHSYTGVTVTGDIADGSTLTIDASAASNISIDLSAATSAAYAITSSAGDDTVKFGSNFSASDSIDGGAGNDTLELGSTGSLITFTASTIQSIETLKIDGSVNLFLDDGNVAAGATLTVDASAAGSTVAVNGSAETNGTFDFIAGTGGDLFSGGAGNDFFDMSNTGGTSTEKGNGGDDTFLFAANFDRLRDSIDGGTGSDTLEFSGAYTSLALSDAHLTGIETLKFLGGHSYAGITITGDIADGSTLTIDASAASNISIDLSAATSSGYVITGSAGNDTVTGSSQADTITGGAGADTLTGGGGADTFSYAALSESNTVNGYDTIPDLSSSDSIHIAGGVPTFFAAGNEDTYQGSLDNDLTDFFSHLGAGKYGVVTLTGDTDPLQGHVFLVIDGDGTMGYAAGADYVIDITNSTADPSLIHFI